MRIRTITFDFWGTLLSDGPSSDDRYKRRRMAEFARILSGVGAIHSPRALDRAYDESGSFLARIWSVHRDVPAEAHVTAIIDALDATLWTRLAVDTRAALVDAYAEPALLVPPVVDETAASALDTLAARGYTLAIVSNTMRTPGVVLRKLLERYRLSGYFRHATFSDEVRIRKPDPEIFLLTLNAVGGDPEHALHVGDDPALDVRGARAARMRVVQRAGSCPDGPDGERPDAVIPRLGALPDVIARLDG